MVFFHRKKRKLDDCLSIWCGVWNRGIPALVVLWLLMPPQRSWGETSELFPDPPILHPTFLEEKEIIVTVDDS